MARSNNRKDKTSNAVHGDNRVSNRNAARQQPNGRKPIICLQGVEKAYQTAAGDFWALKNINTEVYPGEFLGIIGKSGAGKSTFLNMVSGVDSLTKGEVYVNGVTIHRMGENQMALWRGKNMGIIYQSFQLLPMLSLLENVMLPMDFCGLFNAKTSRDWAMNLLDQMGIAEHAHKLPALISGGQQQRVAIARALANDPPILLADEPTGSLDSVTAETIFNVFERLVGEGKTILMVTHDRSLAPRFSRVLEIADGEIAQNREENVLETA